MKDITKIMKAGITAKNMMSNSGREVPNQIIIYTEHGRIFRSYDSNIAFVPCDESVIYLGADWNYSRTTAKYRNEFLGCDTAELRAMLKDGRAVLKREL